MIDEISRKQAKKIHELEIMLGVKNETIEYLHQKIIELTTIMVELETTIQNQKYELRKLNKKIEKERKQNETDNLHSIR